MTHSITALFSIKNLLVYFMWITMLIACASTSPMPTKMSTPYLFILGVTQDAGLPQAGCYQPLCLAAWENPALSLDATSLALIDPAAKRKYIFEATPNFPRQLYQLEVEAPSSQFELSGIFLTHAHIGHYAGLMFLGHESMGANDVPVYAMPKMQHFLKNNGPWSQLIDFKNIALKDLTANEEVNLPGASVEPFLVPHRDEFSETVGYRIIGPQKSAIFIPDINKWSVWDQNLDVLIDTVDYALVDATFYANGELPGRDMSKIPHPFVVETIELLENMPVVQRKKVWFIHMNHTNPLLDPNSVESKHVEGLGYNIARQGIRLPL